MSTETLMNQFRKNNSLVIEKYCQTVDQISDATEKMTEKFVEAIPNLPEENKLWVSDWKKFNKQGVANIKQTLNSFTDTSVTEETPQGYMRAALDSLDNSVERVFEQVSEAQVQSEIYFDKFTEQIPEPGKQWVEQWNKAASSGMEGLKALISKNIELTSQMVAAGADLSSKPAKPEAAKPDSTNKTAPKTGSK